MTFYAINASPRPRGNTATVLSKALEGVRTTLPSAKTELVQLYALHPAGCRSCFACKRKGGSSYGRCALRDELTPLLDQLARADGILFGSPIYFMSVTAALRALVERLLFPFTVYDNAHTSLAPKRVPTAFVYTMNIREEDMALWNLPEQLAPMERMIARTFSEDSERLFVCDTVQFDDYSLYQSECFSEADKKRYREEHFPEDLGQAFALGQRLAERALGRA